MEKFHKFKNWTVDTALNVALLQILYLERISPQRFDTI